MKFQIFLKIEFGMSGADLGGLYRGCAPPPPRDDLGFSNTTGILPKKTVWFIGVEVEQETSAPGSAPECAIEHFVISGFPESGLYYCV